MSYTVKKGEKGKVEIEVEVPKKDFTVSYDKILESLGKDAKISGFRAGKIPRDVLVEHLGVNKVLNEVANFLINKRLSEIFEKEKLFPIDSPKISISKLSADSLFAFSASFTQKPSVKVGAWKKLKVKKVKPKVVAAKDVDSSLKNIFEAWKKQGSKVKDEGEKKKDEGGEKKKGKFIYDAHGNKVYFSDEKETLRSSPARPDAGLKDEVKDDEDKPETKKTGEMKLDDDFAKAVGAKDLNQLKEMIKRDLENIVNNQADLKLEQDIYDKILEVSEVEVPDILVDDELNRIFVRLNSQLEEEGKDLDAYLKERETTIDKLREQWRGQAEKNVKTTLIMDEIGRSEKITVTQAEIDQSMSRFGEGQYKEEQKKDMEKYIALSLFQAKTLELVKKAIAS